MELSRCLALAPERVFVTVTFIPFPALRLHCAARGLQQGDHVRVAGDTGGDVVLEKPTGERLRLERRYALMIEAQLRIEPVDGGSPAGARPEVLRSRDAAGHAPGSSELILPA
jgi:hypothetical protein